MATNTAAASSTTVNTKKANLLNPHAIKHLIDESITEIVTSRGYVEDVRLSNIKLLIGTIIIGIALLAQFYPKKFPENREFLLICIGLYVAFNVLLQFIIHPKESNAILFTYPLPGSFNSTGLVVSSKLPRFSDMYTLTIASADPKSISANKPVELTKSVTKWKKRLRWQYILGQLMTLNLVTTWFTEDGVLVEGLLWKDVGKLIDDYNGENKRK